MYTSIYAIADDIYMTIGEIKSNKIDQYGIALIATPDKEYGSFVGSGQ